MAQTVKNPPVQSLGWEDPLEKGMATHSSTLAWGMLWTEEPGGYSPRGHKESDRTEVLSKHENPVGQGYCPHFTDEETD